MKRIRVSILTVSLLLLLNAGYGQDGHAHEPSSSSQPPLSFTSVLTERLSDPELRDYTVESSVMTVKPGGIDTVSHRHDCELFGYVLEGEVDIALVTKQTTTYKAGQMFYEKRNILHTVTRNVSAEKPAKVLLIFIIKQGRPGYTPEYPDKGKR